MIRFIIFLALEVNAGAQTTAGKLWIELSAKRATLPALRQEFEVTQVTSRQSHISTWKRRELLDMSNGQWRVNIFGGLGNSIRIFDGQNLYYLEDGSPEYIHSKLHPKAVIPLPLPAPYSSIRGDWSKAVEVSRQPCGNSGQGNQCVVLDVPIRHWERDPTGNYKKLLEGKGRLMLDLELGVLLSMKTVELIEERNGNYQIETTYKLNSMSIGLPVDPNLFKLPSSATTEVKELPDWDAARIKRLLGGKPAPELTVNDIRGNTLSISECNSSGG